MQYGKPFPTAMKKNGPNVFGDVRFAYEYEGQCYNASFQPVDSRGNVMPLPPAPVRAAAAQPTPPVTDSQPEDDDDDIPQDEKEIDLRAWADGTAKYAFNVIQAEIARLWDITDVKSKQMAISIINEKVPAAA